MSALDVFQYAGQQVRTVIVDGEAWFVTADVLAILELDRTALRRLDDDEKGVDSIHTPGGDQSVSIVSEPGLFALILGSRKAEARAFKRWVTHEVLPQIRRTGQFGAALPTSFAEALELAAAEVRQREALEARVAADAPKVEAYDRLMDSDGYFSMEAVAKMIGGIGRTTLYRRLREAGVIQSGSTLPYQRHAHHFAVVARSWRDPEGVEHPSQTTKLRPSGLPFILRKLGLSEASLPLL